MSKIDFSDPAVISALSAALEAAGVDGIEITQASRMLKIVVGRSGAATVSAPSTPGKAARMLPARAPMAGLFARAPKLEADMPLDVNTGDLLGCVTIGPVRVPVRAQGVGKITRMLAEDGAMVGYGDPLFEIEPQA